MSGTERGHLLIRHTGALFSNRQDIPASLSKRRQRSLRKVFVGQKIHTVLRDKTCSSRRRSLA
jgi:hypothetical protein